MNPANKVALVLGGSSGIGFATAAELLRNGCKHVSITGLHDCKGHNAVKFLEGYYGKGKASFIRANLNNNRQSEDVFRCILNNFKGIDIVINSVGIIDGKNWEKELATNILGAIRSTLLAYDFMGKDSIGNGGVIINVCGIMGLDPLPGSPTFAAAKHALIGFSKSMGHKTHEFTTGVRLMSLCPGFTHTSLLKHLSEKAMTNMGHILEFDVERSKKQSTEPCAKAVIHLIKKGDSASVWVVEGSQLFKCQIPHRKEYSRLICNYI